MDRIVGLGGKTKGIVLATVLAIVLGLVTPVAESAYTAELSLAPSSALAGATVAADGTGHTPNGTEVEIHWQTETGPLLATVQTDENGEYSTSIAIPGGAAPGNYTVVSCETAFADCDDITHEFHVGATTSFTVTLPPSPTTTSTIAASVTTTSTVATVTTAATATTTTVPDDVLIPLDLPGFISVIGIGDRGQYGVHTSPIDGFDPVLYIPRCTPPDGATILDFDTGWPGRPDLSAHPELDTLSGLVVTAPSGTITPRQAVHTAPAHLRWVARFNEPQRYVGLYLGDEALSGNMIEFVALDSTGAVVAADRLTDLQAPVNTCMAVRVEGDPTISEVLIRTELDADLYFDRLFFSSTGDLPAPPRPEHGSIEFLMPTSGREVPTRARQVVLGTIRIPVGFIIDQVAMSVPRWNRTRTDIRMIDFFPLWVDGDDQLYSFVAGGIYLPEGESFISVTATGPGVIASAFVDVIGVGAPPLHPEDVPGRVDIDPITLEVTQAIRGPVDLIPPGTAIPDRADTVLVQNKKTVVRAFARLVFPDGGTYTGSVPVNAELVGTRGGVALPGSPLAPERATTDLRVSDDRANAYHNSKQETALSWNFVLPDSWTDPGSIDLRLEVNSPVLLGHVDEQEGFDGELNQIGLNGVVFRSKNAPAVNVWLVDYYYRCGAAGTVRPDQGRSDTRAESFCMGRAEGDIARALPSPWDAAVAVLESWNMAPFPGAFPTSFDVWTYAFATDGVPADSYLTPGSPQEGFWLGVAFRMDLVVGSDGYNTLNALMSSFVRGKAWGSPSFFRVTTNPSTFLHEAAHTMGLRHTGHGHSESYWVARWSGDHGQIDSSREVVSAFDTWNMQALPYAGLHDLMSYGGERWTSQAVWQHIEDAVGSGFARTDNRVDDDIWRLFGEIFGGAPPDDGEVVVFRGGLTEDDGVLLEHGFNLPGGTFVADGELVFRVLDADGSVLSESTTALLEPGDSSGDERSFSIAVHMPVGAAEVVIELDGEEIDRRDVAAAPAEVGLATPPVGPLVDPIEISWTTVGNSAEQYLLEITRDGEEWFPIAITTETSVTFDPSMYPFQGPGWTMRVQASSGLAIAISPEVDIEFARRPATPMIVMPLDGAVVSSNSLLQLQAAVSRFSLGEEEEFVWTLDGAQVAQGPTGLTFAGEPGSHVITVTSPLSGLESSATITVVADADLDGISDDWETEWGLDPEDPEDAALDADGDGLAAWQEYKYGAAPDSIDTDGDDYSDDVEVAIGTDPNDASSIPAAVVDGAEVARLSGGPPVDDGGGGGLSTTLIVLLTAVAAAVLVGGIFWFKGREI